MGDADEFPGFFALIDVAHLRESSSIEVAAQKDATITSVQILTYSNASGQ